MKTYKDKVSGETLYVRQSTDLTEYYKDKAMTVYHRLDGPAIECLDGYKAWYANDKRHRVDGPAFESKRHKEWWVDGVVITLIYPSGRYEGPTRLQDTLNKLI